MDWIELLILLAVFYLLPALLQLIGKKRPPAQLPGEEEAWELPTEDAGRPGTARAPQPVPAEQPSRITKVEDVGGWSDGWGAWPGLEVEDEEETATEGVTAESFRREDVPAEAVPVEVIPAPMVVSLEPLQIDREAEHLRFHKRLAALPAPARVAIRTSAAAPVLRGTAEIRRAIILAEVLGPPRALRGPDQEN